VKNPEAGLIRSQQQTLIPIADDFKKYLGVKPDAKLVLEAHADPRGSEEYNQALTERRAARVKGFLGEHGVPAESIETRAFGKQTQLTAAEVKQSVESDPALTPEERKRIIRNMKTIVLAQNRRVDITLNAPGVESQQSVRQFPFNAEDALTLIGGREKPKVTPPARNTTRRPAARRRKPKQ
jgi:hypothetical protein